METERFHCQSHISSDISRLRKAPRTEKRTDTPTAVGTEVKKGTGWNAQNSFSNIHA